MSLLQLSLISHELAQSEQFGILNHSQAEVSLPRNGGHPTGVRERPHSGLAGATGRPRGDPEPRDTAGEGKVGMKEEGEIKLCIEN